MTGRSNRRIAFENLSTSSFLKFCVVGGFGFILDAGLTELLAANGLDPLSARLVAMAVALGVTFILNRNFSFTASRHGTIVGQGSRYLLVSMGSAAVNYLGYVAALALFPGLRLFWGVVFGSALAIAFSYIGYALLAFRKPPGQG